MPLGKGMNPSILSILNYKEIVERIGFFILVK